MNVKLKRVSAGAAVALLDRAPTGSAADFIPRVRPVFVAGGSRELSQVPPLPVRDADGVRHPSAVLRTPGDARERARRELFEDLARVGRHLEGERR
jgi:hypothetical protein